MDTEPNFTTIAEIKDANARLGHFWFTPDTMRFFDSKIVSPLPIGGRYFVTSEQRPDGFMGVPAGVRKYTIREARANGDIRTVGGFQQFTTHAEARAVARHLAETVRAGRIPLLGEAHCPNCSAELPLGACVSCPSCGVDSYALLPEESADIAQAAVS